VVRTLRDIDEVNKEADKDSTNAVVQLRQGNICTPNVLGYF